MANISLGQNTSDLYRIYVTQDNKNIKSEDIVAAEFIFDRVHKYFSNEEDAENENVMYDENKGCFIIGLTQQETVYWKSQIPVQIRIKFSDGVVESSCIQYVNVRKSLSSSIL